MADPIEKIAFPKVPLMSAGFEWKSFDPSLEIPKLLHQTYSSRDLPDILEENVKKIKSINPDWEHRLYDDQDQRKFISESYGKSFLSLYDKINSKYGAARADFFRYLLIYELGGGLS